MAISHVLAHVAVPVFFLISGYLFFRGLEGWDKSKWKRKIFSRTKTLLIPYIIWISLYAVFTGTVPSITDYWCSVKWNFNRIDLWGNPNIASSPLLVPMWFIRDLIICICLTPLFWMLFHSARNRYQLIRLIASVCVFTVLYLTQTAFQIPGLSILSLFYFAFGCVIALNGIKLEELISNKNIRLIIISFALLLLGVEVIYDGHNTEIGNLIYPFYVLSAVIAVIICMSSLLNYSNMQYSRKASVLSFFENQADVTFFIFASHIFVLPYVNAVINKIMVISALKMLNDNQVFISIVYMFKISVIVSTCIVVYKLLHRYTPHIAKLLCGK